MSKELDTGSGGFSARLKQAAEHAGVPYSQQAIASQIREDRRKVDGWMKNDSLPRADVLFTLAERLGVDARWLATGRGEMLKQGGHKVAEPSIHYPAAEVPDAEGLLFLIKTFLDANSSNRRRLTEFARAIVTTDARTRSQARRGKR